MITPDIPIKIDLYGKPFDWSEGGLSLNQLIVAENYLRFVLKFFERKRCGRENADNYNNTPISGGEHSNGGERKRKKKEKKPIGKILEDTANKIRASGPELTIWLESDSGKHRKLKRESALQKSFEKNVRNDTSDLKPLVAAKKGEWTQNRNETLLWLVWRQVSLAQALLVLYSFSANDLDGFTFEEIIFIIEFVAHNQNSLGCEALEVEAIKLISGENFRLLLIHTQ
jgi:hypothetical protein